jgi:4-hydroxybenzoate polyprenyltransferase
MSTLRTYARLCRFPAVFTAMADIFLGYLLTHPSLNPPQKFLGLLASSSGLYLAGMVLNDVFDREIDAKERPNRPIPSGKVPLKNAIGLAVLLIAVGTGAASTVSPTSLIVAVILLANILLYDGWAKKTPIGPIAMGSCRFLNVILGASAAGSSLKDVFAMPQLLVAIGMGVYVTGVTLFAKKEAERSKRGPLMGALLVIDLGLLLLLCWIAPQVQPYFERLGITVIHGDADPWRGMVILAMVAFVLNRRVLAAISDPSPMAVQNAVRVLLLSIITIDAMLIYNWLGDAGTLYAVGVIALLIPSFLLGRWMSIT